MGQPRDRDRIRSGIERKKLKKIGIKIPTILVDVVKAEIIDKKIVFLVFKLSIVLKKQ